MAGVQLPVRPGTKLVLGAVLFCLFLSGAAGLVYEVVWSRYLALFLGHASYAVVAVLMAFMGGLAAGNWWIGRLADRVKRPLAVYGWLELAIGLYAIAFPTYYELCYGLYVSMVRSWAPGPAAGFVLKFCFSLAAILFPTVLMGGTLPMITRLVTKTLGEMQGRVAALYSVNSAGAVLGVVLADFWWIQAIGLSATVLAAASMNLAVGCIGLFLSGWMREGVEVGPVQTRAVEQAADPENGGASEEVYRPGDRFLAIFAIGLSGFVAMLYQVAWTRVLSLALGSSTHAFSIMLITFIAGIAVGAWVVTRARFARRPFRAFGFAELALAATLGVSMFFYAYLPYWFVRLAGLLSRTEAAYPVYVLCQALICFGVMFIPTLCLGMTLPLVSRVAASAVSEAGSAVGRVFAVNTLGTVLGTCLTGFLFLPKLGLARTFALGVGLNAWIGLAVLTRTNGLRIRISTVPMLVAVAGMVWAAGPLFDRTWQGALTLGMWRPGITPPSRSEFLEVARTANIRFYRDGAGATVSVHGDRVDGTNLFLKVNGKTDASTFTDMMTQVLSAQVPLALHPDAQDVLVVGLGSGVTAGSVLARSSVRSLDVVEISPEVIEGAKMFSNYNRDVFHDKRLRMIIDDAKSFLLSTDKRYDVIISEPSNPWMAGVANVFSREFYANCRAHLAPGGLMVQWMQLYEFSDAAFDIFLATFTSEFPSVSLWRTDTADLVLVGTVEPRKHDVDKVVAALSEPEVKADLERLGLSNPVLFLGREVVSSEFGALIPAVGTRQHSDFYPVLEYVAQRDFFLRRTARRFQQLDENFSRRAETLLGQYLARHKLTKEDRTAFTRFYLAEERRFVDIMDSFLLRWMQDDPDALEPHEIATRFKRLEASAEHDALRYALLGQKMYERAKTNPTLLRHYGLSLMRTYLEQRSVFYAPPTDHLSQVLQTLIQVDPDNQRLYQAYLAELAWDRGDDQSCINYGRLALLSDLPRGANKFKLDASAPLLLVTRMADSYRRLGQLKEAADVCNRAVQMDYFNERTRYDALLFEVTQRRVIAELAAATQGNK